MQTFNYRKASELSDVTAQFRILAGGTNLIDYMKLDVETPRAVLDINALPLKDIKGHSDGSLYIGALVKNAVLAHHDFVKKNYPVLSLALLSGASAQLRNKATTSGNLMQRTRCVYFRDIAKPCNKREPKSGCPAIDGHNRNLAILGVSDSCIATNPSDMNVAMMALEATVHIQAGESKKDVPISEFYFLPGNTPEKEFNLSPGEIITGVTLPALDKNAKSTYLKLRDRASYEFALASAAVIMTTKNGVIEKVRIAMGGIGTRPWRMLEAEKTLEGRAPSEALFKAAAEVALKNAKPQSENGFKVELAKRCLVQALKTVNS